MRNALPSTIKSACHGQHDHPFGNHHEAQTVQLAADEFVVDSHYRFEGNSDPGDEAVVYAISSAKHNLKGTLVNGYGLSADGATDELVRTLQEKAR